MVRMVGAIKEIITVLDWNRELDVEVVVELVIDMLLIANVLAVLARF